jgi:transmembrane sensor
MRSNVDWDLLAMYVLGECSDEQVERVERWLAEDPLRNDVVEELRKVYEKTGKAPEERTDDERRQEQTWAQVQAHMASSSQPKREDQPRRVPNRRARHRRESSLPRIAAIVAGVILLVVLIDQLWRSPNEVGDGPETKTFITQRGERATIRLADSTRVRLNADSRLELVPGFGTGTRTVRLIGEAYFTVASDANRPFHVRAGGTTTEVLGTEFAVNAYSKAVEVVVAEGRVAFRSLQSTTSQGEAPSEAVLTQREAATLEDNRLSIASEVDLDRHLAWLRGELVFDDAAFQAVAQELERRYDVAIRREGATVRGQLTARFSEEQSLDKVLTVVASVFDLAYQREGRSIRFYSAEEPAP